MHEARVVPPIPDLAVCSEQWSVIKWVNSQEKNVYVNPIQSCSRVPLHWTLKVILRKRGFALSVMVATPYCESLYCESALNNAVVMSAICALCCVKNLIFCFNHIELFHAAISRAHWWENLINAFMNWVGSSWRLSFDCDFESDHVANGSSSNMWP